MYDNRNRLTHITKYEYDDSNRLTKTLDPLNHQTLTAYDKVGNIIQTTDAKGRVTKSGYDVLNRQTSVTQAFGTVDATTTAYGYDAVGNLTTITDGRSHTTIYTPDALNRRIKTTDVYGNVTETEYYDTPALVAIVIASELPTVIDSTNIGKIVKQIDANGHSTLTIYDLQGRVTDTYDATRHRTSHLTYQKDDRIQTSTDTFGQITSYAYNDALRQTVITDPLGVTITKKYDKVGNLTDIIDSQNRTNGGYVTGANNQLVSDGIYNYQYDGEGNRTKRTNIATGVVDEYVWDYRNRLTTVTSKDSNGVVTQTVGYEYDTDDQRISKTVNGVVEKYVIDRNQIAYVTDASGTQTFHYLYGTNVDAVMAQDSPTGMVWSLTDRLGSIDTLTDAGGAVINKRTFDSFGRVLSETNPGVVFRYGYTGRELDSETGLHYYRARHYDAANGRFISVDPAGFSAGDTNLYRYVGNSSTM